MATPITSLPALTPLTQAMLNVAYGVPKYTATRNKLLVVSFLAKSRYFASPYISDRRAHVTLPLIDTLIQKVPCGLNPTPRYFFHPAVNRNLPICTKKKLSNTILMPLRSGHPPPAKPLSAHDAFRAVKAAARGDAIGEEIVVENIPAEFALQVIFSVEEDRTFTGHSLR